MVGVDWASTVLPLVIVATVAVVAVTWLLLVRVFRKTRAGRRAARFLDTGGADLSPQDSVKYKNQHPGAGGFG
jgi:hypothetical protein